MPLAEDTGTVDERRVLASGTIENCVEYGIQRKEQVGLLLLTTKMTLLVLASKM